MNFSSNFCAFHRFPASLVHLPCQSLCVSAVEGGRDFPSKALFVDYANLPDAVPEYVFPKHFAMAREVEKAGCLLRFAQNLILFFPLSFFLYFFSFLLKRYIAGLKESSSPTFLFFFFPCEK